MDFLISYIFELSLCSLLLTILYYPESMVVGKVLQQT
jgi:hypothetical protein